MANIELRYEGFASAGQRNQHLGGLRRMRRRWRLLWRLQRRKGSRAIIGFGMTERQRADLGLDTGRRRYDVIGQLVRAMMAR